MRLAIFINGKEGDGKHLEFTAKYVPSRGIHAIFYECFEVGDGVLHYTAVVAAPIERCHAQRGRALTRIRKKGKVRHAPIGECRGDRAIPIPVKFPGVLQCDNVGQAEEEVCMQVASVKVADVQHVPRCILIAMYEKCYTVAGARRTDIKGTEGCRRRQLWYRAGHGEILTVKPWMEMGIKTCHRVVHGIRDGDIPRAGIYRHEEVCATAIEHCTDEKTMSRIEMKSERLRITFYCKQR